MVQHSPGSVRSGQYGEPPQLPRAISHRGPAGQGLVMTLEVDIVLVGRRRVLGKLWKPEAGDLLGMRHRGAAIDPLYHLHHLWLMGNAVEGLKLVDFVVYPRILRVPFRATRIEVGDPIQRVSPLTHPSPILHDGQHLAPQLAQQVRTLQFPEEKVAVEIQPPPQLSRILMGVVGNPEFPPLLLWIFHTHEPI